MKISKRFFPIMLNIGLMIMVISTWVGVDETVQVIKYSRWINELTKHAIVYPPSILWNWTALLVFESVSASLIVTGGIFSKIRFLWILLILTGVMSILSFSGAFIWHYPYSDWTGSFSITYSALDLLYLLPGLLCIIIGIILRQRKQNQKDNM